MELTRKGKNSRACCPFHEEKTPSLSVDPEKGLYHCFGCKEGGNAFTFLEKTEGLGFGEALKKLAAEASVDLSRYETEPGPSSDESARLRGLNEMACSFYQQCLLKSKSGQRARDYLAGRKISTKSVEEWRLGYAPEGWEHLLKLAAKRKIGPDQVAMAGLAVQREGATGITTGSAIGSCSRSGIGRPGDRLRRAGADRRGPAEVPEQPGDAALHQGALLFGLDRARAAIRTRTVAVVWRATRT